MRTRWASAVAVAVALSSWATGAAPASSAAAVDTTGGAAGPVDSPDLTTWWHDEGVATSEPIADGQVRRSEFYDVSVATAAAPEDLRDSFVYMSVPRSGREKAGYTDEDGAEFAAASDLTMSWSSFEYATDVWVDVKLKTGEPIASVDDVTIRPTDLGLEKQLVDESTVRVHVPYRAEGLRFSVEFDSQLVTSYNDLSGASGVLTTEPEGNRAIHTEPRNAMLIFANPKLSGAEAERTIPTDASGTIHRPAPGRVGDLSDVDSEIVYFEPGVYEMGSDRHAVLPENVTWVYLSPGAYVKGAFRFAHETPERFRVTGRGVLSGEQYVYEADTANGYQRSVADNCHVTCVKMLQFESSPDAQTLEIEGVTINEPPYHSFVVYAHEDGAEVGVERFRMDVRNYKQVGSWYWQTDGIELYAGGRMQDTFFHANDDVLKLYHSDVEIDRTVIWKNENGPVFQWGWTPREIDGVRVSATDIIHNRMAWKDAKYNTCVFNSSTHWEDMGADDRADPDMTVRNMTFTDTRVEGAVNCGIRIFALSRTENLLIDGFEVESWNGLDASSQVSLLTRHADGDGERVVIGNEVTDGNGIRLHNYTVAGESILKAEDNWAADEPGRLGFDADTWESWDATSDNQPTGRAPQLTLDGLDDGMIAPSRDITISGSTDAPRVTVRVAGVETEVPVAGGAFSFETALPDISNRIVVSAVGENGVMAVERRTIIAYGTEVGALSDPAGDDRGPGTYTYPTDSAFNPGSFDLREFAVYQDGDMARFVATTEGEIRNPWGGDGMSTQRLNIYLRTSPSKAPTPLLPGTATSAAGPWVFAIVADGRYPTARFGAGVFGEDLKRVAEVELDVDPRGRIVVSVPAAVFDGVDLSRVGYQVSIFSGAEESEGQGGVRPVYSAECAQGVGCPTFVGPYRFGGGAGEWTDATETRDTDTRDSNAIDILSGRSPQSRVLDWGRGPVVVPYLFLSRR